MNRHGYEKSYSILGCNEFTVYNVTIPFCYMIQYVQKRYKNGKYNRSNIHNNDGLRKYTFFYIRVIV